MRGSFRQYRDPKPLILEEDSADECGTSSRAFVGSRSCNSVKSGSSRIVEEMGGPYKRKKYHAGDTHLKKGWRVKRRTKDLDQVRKKIISSTGKYITENSVHERSLTSEMLLELFSFMVESLKINIMSKST